MHTETEQVEAEKGDSGPLLCEQYEITGHLGTGGVGDVYLAKDNKAGRRVAIKILKNIDDEVVGDIPERFKQEALKCIELSHPNLVKGFDYIEFEYFKYGEREYRNTAGYVMEYVEGKSAVRFMKQSYRSFQQINSITEEVLSALEYLHGQGIVHRDIKTENIYITEEGSVKLLDLGMMKDISSDILTKPGALLGTVQYMAPEYLIKKVINGSCDVYAVGIVLLELITGQRLYWDMCEKSVMQHLVDTRFKIEPRVLNYLPPKYKYIVLKATAYEPADRFKSAAEMAEMLEKHEERLFKRLLKKEYGMTATIPGANRRRGERSMVWLYILAVIVGAVLAIGWYATARL